MSCWSNQSQTFREPFGDATAPRSCSSQALWHHHRAVPGGSGDVQRDPHPCISVGNLQFGAGHVGALPKLP